MSREVHVRFCERLGHLSPADSTDDIDTAEVLSVSGNRLHQRKECDSHSADVPGSKKKFRWSAFLGTRLLCIDSRS